ncbi:prokaryotic ubiquitin-like protein Pup [Saccharopolyspora kobensis]|uniref:Prokaryotic ubiquitin-like protein Pup n=1 Tax=Saccharopolyspora kobensis TaxID=146035 RepID=A0A1H6AF53_9PSEU|nr:ubiquitin-like protein Pup [Saccharopolyspora kobensis]SEG47131.1 prokaryotic ubiquitin-like protein Pup [Saccharopolyspora kobensis]SFE55820.1 prokaryotic ubiquitin-like protein Pup [Saccharopolyspora kobensis]
MHQEKNHQRHREGDDVETEPEPTGGQRRDKLNEDTEATLDEIDDVLEDNAEDFVRSYVQKGGE